MKQFCILAVVYTLVYIISFHYLPYTFWADSYDYFSFSNALKDYNASLKGLFYGRAFTLPLLYGILGTQNLIVIFQVGLYLFSFLFLSYAASLLFSHNRVLRWISCIMILGLSFSNNLFFWPYAFLSESVAISMVNMMIGLIIFYIHTGSLLKQYRIMGGLMVLGFFFSHLRDLHMYLVFLLIPVLWIYTSRKSISLLSAIGLMALVFTGNICFQQHLIAKSERYKLSMVNVIGKRILVDESYTSWFMERGMPMNDEIMSYRGKMAYDTTASGIHNFGAFLDHTILEKYQLFLITHPRYALRPLKWEHEMVFDNTLINYSQHVKRPFIAEKATVFLWPVRWVLFPSTLFFALILFYRQKLCVKAMVGWMICWAGMVGILLLSYHGDANETDRHGLLLNYLLRFCWLLCMLRAADEIGKLVKEKIRLRKSQPAAILKNHS